MEFGLTPEQEEFRKQVREFALRELLPGYLERDRTRTYPAELQVKIRALIGRPADVDFIRAGIAVEELARGDLNCAFWGQAAAGSSPLFAEAEPTLRKYLGEEDDQVGLALTEPEAGSDLGALRTTARREGDTWILDGVKNSVSFLNAPVFVVFARTGPLEEGWRGVRAFAVPRSAAGLEFEEFSDLGGRSIPRGTLSLKGVRVPQGDQLWGGPSGEATAEGRGSFRHMVQFFNTNKAYIGLMSIGATQQTLDEIVDYAKSRIAYGRPIARFQGVAFPIAEAATYLEMSRLLCYKALWLRQQNLDHMAEGAMAKWFIPGKCVEILNECMVIRGHLGYTESLPIAQRLRDVAGWQIGDGPPQIQKLMISRKIFGREFEPM
jgi:cyclohexanecarboxyl-CoA dehydrogenase